MQARRTVPRMMLEIVCTVETQFVLLRAPAKLLSHGGEEAFECFPRCLLAGEDGFAACSIN